MKPNWGQVKGSKWGQVVIENCKRYKEALRPRAKGERDIYSLIQVLANDENRDQQRKAVAETLRNCNDEELLQTRLQAAVDAIVRHRIPGNFERIGVYINETNPEFMKRFLPLTRPLFLRRLLVDYLKILNREVRMGKPAAEAMKGRLLALAGQIRPAEKYSYACSLLNNNLRILGEASNLTYRTHFISSPPIPRLANIDAGFQLFAEHIAETDPGLVDYMLEAAGTEKYGYVVEALTVLLSGKACPLDKRAAEQVKGYLKETASAMPGLLRSEWSARVFCEKLDHPESPLHEILMSVAGIREARKAERMAGQTFIGQDSLMIENEKILRRATRILMAEPVSENKDNYAFLLLDRKLLKKGPVVAGHRCYFLTDNNKPSSRIATAGDIKDFESTLPLRASDDERKAANVEKIVSACVAYYRENGYLPSGTVWARLANANQMTMLYRNKTAVFESLRANGIPLIGATWEEMSANSRNMPPDILKAVADLGPEADYYIPKGRLWCKIGKKRVIGWRKYRDDLEKSLGRPVVLIYLKRDVKNNRIKIHAICQEKQGVKDETVEDEIKLTAKNEIALMSKIQTIKIWRLLRMQTRVCPIKANPQTGFFYFSRAKCGGNYIGLALMVNGDDALAQVKVRLCEPMHRRPYVEIKIPGAPTEKLILNRNYAPLCYDRTSGLGSYVIYRILERQTRLAQGGDSRFQESPFILAHPDLLEKLRSSRDRKYSTLGLAALAFCRRAGFEEYTPANFQRAIEDPRNKPTVLAREDYTLLYDLRKRYGVLPVSRRGYYPTTHSVYAAIFNNAGRQYDAGKIYTPAEIQTVLNHWRNSVGQLKQTDPKLLLAAQREKLKLLPGPSAAVVDPLVGYLRFLESSVLTEQEARQLHQRMINGDAAARLELANRLASLTPGVVREFMGAGDLIPSTRTDYYVSTAGAALASFIASGGLERWRPDSGIGLIDSARSAMIMELADTQMGYKRDRPWFSKDDAAGDTTRESFYGEEMAYRRKELMLSKEEWEPTDIEYFDLPEKEKVAADMASFLKSHNFENMLKDCGIKHCAVYICGSMSIGGQAHKGISNLNVLFLTDASSDQNFELLKRLRALLGGNFSQDHDFEIGALPSIMIGLNGTFDQAIREGNGFIILILNNQLGSPERGLATVEVGSINGYSPSLEKDQRIAITRRLARFAFHAAGSSFEYAGRKFEEPPNGILISAYPENAPSFLSAGLNEELARIAATEARMQAGPAAVTSEKLVTTARERFISKQTGKKMEAEIKARARQNSLAASSVLRPRAALERDVAEGKEINFDENKLNTLFAVLEDYAFRRLGVSLKKGMLLLSGILRTFPKEMRANWPYEVLTLVYKSLQETNKYLNLDYNNFPNLNRRQTIRNSLVETLMPACLDLAETLKVINSLPEAPDELRNQLGAVSKLNVLISFYTTLSSHAVYFIDNRQILADFTEWLCRPENHMRREVFSDLFKTTGIEVRVSPELVRPVERIFFTKDSARYFQLVVYAINEFLRKQRKEAIPILDKSKDKTTPQIETQI